jgi:hypothetical protein
MRNEEEVTTSDATEASVLEETPIEETPMTTSKEAAVSADSKFQELLNKTMTRRWNITAIVLLTFLFIAAGITAAVHGKTVLDQEWKEILLLMLGAFIGSYGKIIDYWFSDTDKDKMLVQKMDEEDGQSLSNTLGG